MGKLSFEVINNSELEHLPAQVISLSNRTLLESV